MVFCSCCYKVFNILFKYFYHRHLNTTDIFWTNPIYKDNSSYKKRLQHIKSTNPFIVRLPPNVDTVAKVLYEDEHDLVVVMPPVVSNVDGWVVWCLARKEGRLIHFDNDVTRRVSYSCSCCIWNIVHQIIFTAWQFTDLPHFVYVHTQYVWYKHALWASWRYM